MKSCLIRVGLPLPGGALPEAARLAEWPVLFSANAFWKASRQRFRKPKALPADSALDSAGFVATRLYGDYRWSAEAYLDLAATWPWTWYASMDLCCEPQIARDAAAVAHRVAETARRYRALMALADARGQSRPMPVLQGWQPDDYRRCAALMPDDWPALAGVGSVCRRGVRDLLAIIDGLDRTLPPQVRLHLFGVKTEALSQVGRHPRIASMDSMAWDLEARYTKGPEGCTMQHRIAVATLWRARQIAASNGASWVWQPELWC